MREAYYGGTTLTGKGQSVGLLQFAGYNLNDVTTCFTNVKQPLTVAVPVCPRMVRALAAREAATIQSKCWILKWRSPWRRA